MRVFNPAQQFSVVILLVAAVQQSTYADTKEFGESVQADKLPSFESMLATAMKHHPNVRAAQAELDRTRLQVAKEIRAFRDEWQAQLAKLAAAEIAIRDVARLSALQDGAIAGKKILEAKRLAESSRFQAAIAKARLKELKTMLPMLLGAAVKAQPVGKEDPDHAHEPHDHHHHDHHSIPAAVEKLLRERLKVLIELAKLQQSAYEKGEASFDAVSSAQMQLLAAKFELAKSGHERLKIRQEMREIARQMEKVTTALFQAKEATKVDVLKAKAFRLQAEAELATEHSAAKHEH